MESELIQTLKGLLQCIIDGTDNLPKSECDTPTKDEKTGYTSIFKATTDFRKGQRHYAKIIMEFIDNCLNDNEQ